MNSPFRQRLIVAHIRTLKRVHKLDQYSEVQVYILNKKPINCRNVHYIVK